MNLMATMQLTHNSRKLIALRGVKPIPMCKEKRVALVASRLLHQMIRHQMNVQYVNVQTFVKNASRVAISAVGLFATIVFWHATIAMYNFALIVALPRQQKLKAENFANNVVKITNQPHLLAKVLEKEKVYSLTKENKSEGNPIKVIT